MRFLHGLIGFVLFVLLAVGAVLVVNAALFPDPWSQAVDALRDARLLALVGGIVFLLLTVLYALTGLRRRAPEQFISFENEGGAVSISIKAVRDFLARLAEEFAAVISLDPIIRAPGGTIEVELNVRVRSGTQIPELCRLLQDRVRESIKDSLGLSEVRGVKINVREIVAAAPAKKHDEAVEWEGAARP
jgi:hypothetical protein